MKIIEISWIKFYYLLILNIFIFNVLLCENIDELFKIELFFICFYSSKDIINLSSFNISNNFESLDTYSSVVPGNTYDQNGNVVIKSIYIIDLNLIYKLIYFLKF